MTARPQRALITGASAGLGAEFARQLAAIGCELYLVARRQDRLEALAAEIQATHSVAVHCIVADLSDPASPARIAAETHDTVGWLINNAGSGGDNLIEHRSWQDHQAFLQLMMLSVAELCHRFLPAMAEQNFGRVINVASVAGRVALPAGASYGPSKAYLIALSEELAQSFAGSNVHISALCPGFTHTEFHDPPELAAAKAKTPAWLWYPAATVVRDGLKGVERGAPIVISGRLYRWLDLLLLQGWTRPLVRRLTRGRNQHWRTSKP